MAELSKRIVPLTAHFIAALVAVFVLFGPYLANCLRGLTRYLYMWQRYDMVLLLGMIAGLAMLAVAIDAVLRRCNRPVLLRVYHHLFVIILGAGLLANLAFYCSKSDGWHIGRTGMEMQTLWLLLATVVAYSFARPASRLVGWCRTFCLVLSPAVPIVAFQLLTRPTYPLVRDALPAGIDTSKTAAANQKPPAPVYLFVFDEWSYERTYESEALRPSFANLAKLTARSTVFRNAHSPGEDTAWSMPGLLFQTDLRPTFGNGELGFVLGGRTVPLRQSECLFSAIPEQAYRRIMVGAFLPYAAWLDGRVDVCRSYCFYPRGTGLVEDLTVHAINAASYFTDPWSVLASSKLKTPVHDRHILRLYEWMRQDVLDVIAAQPANTFAVFHCMLPHEPFIVDADGCYLGPDDAAWVRPNVEGYTRNLARLDRLIGEYMVAIERAGRFDDALIILTSDHSWRFDPARKGGQVRSPVTHVPLFVKLPGQRDSVVVDERFENRMMGSLIRFALGANDGPGRIADWVHQLGSSPGHSLRAETLASRQSRTQ